MLSEWDLLFSGMQVNNTMLWSGPVNTGKKRCESTYQIFIGDACEQWMFGEVLHHPDVYFLHICHGIHQTLE